MTKRRPIPDDFEAESLYAREAWFVHEIVEITDEHVRAIMDTTRLGPLVDAQRLVGGHQKHVPGAVAIHTAATLANLHVVYALGIRPSEGWAGYGTRVREARFPTMGKIGPEAELLATCEKHRNVRGAHFMEYAFEYRQEGEVFFQSQQSAVWHRAENT